jgi:peptidoglycan/xylan/chitin deacetylase (PgdA/CDA1 family)
MKYPTTSAHGIMFHHLHGGQHKPVQGSISQENLEAILQFVGVQQFLTPMQWLEKLDSDRLDPEDLCLTFDDGLLCQFDIALPLLEKYRLNAFWFVYSGVFEGQIQLGKLEIYRAFRCQYFPNIDDFYTVFFERVFDAGFSEKISEVVTEARIRQMISVFPFYSVNDVRFRLVRDLVLGRQEYELIMDGLIHDRGPSLHELAKGLWMSDEHLKYLADQGHVVGLHSYSHPTALADLPYTEQREEYQKNYQHILRVCGRPPEAVAHPTNSYNQETLEILAGLGIRFGFRSNMATANAIGQSNPNRYEMAREDNANIQRMVGASK